MERRFQFSIRFLLVATAAVGAGAATARLEPSRQATFAVGCVTVLFATGAIVGAAQTRGRLRIFWIGNSVVLGIALIFAGSTLWAMLMYGESAYPVGQYTPGKFASVWCAAPLNGLFAVFLHWLFSPRRASIRFPSAAIAAVLLGLLVAAFVVGVQFGEMRERDRRDQEQQVEMDEETETLDEPPA